MKNKLLAAQFTRAARRENEPELIREQSARDFPMVERFRTMHRDGALLHSESRAYNACASFVWSPAISRYAMTLVSMTSTVYAQSVAPPCDR